MAAWRRLSFTSHSDSTSAQIFGFNQTYEFDVSGLSNIEAITFTWTGRYTWVGDIAIPGLRIAPRAGDATIKFGGFGSGTTPNNTVQTATLVAIDDLDQNLTNSLLNPGLAQFNIETEFGLGEPGFPLSSITLETLEVTADVQLAQVPEPATLLLLGVGLAAPVARRWRRGKQE